MLIVSNGFSRFHLAAAAAEAYKRGLLSCFITGAYPTRRAQQVIAALGLKNNRKLGRLAARSEPIPEALIRPAWSSEALYVLAMLAQNHGIGSVGQRLNIASFRHYGHRAVRHVEEAAAQGARLYHYRAGFGHESVRAAKRLGLFTLCDHSLAHPAVLHTLIANRGQLPGHDEKRVLDALWSDILEDINQADAVLVNSEFVKETFVHEGYDASRIHVIYLGVDDAFLHDVPPRPAPAKTEGPIRLLFAGFFERRKGAETVIAALENLNDIPWQLEIAGHVAKDIAASHSEFFRDPRVKFLGLLSRSQLAGSMVAADVFVFPSLAEGSARVVFEALACGCYVVTTPNSGSVVEDGVHGSLIAPGDAPALAHVIRRAFADREAVAAIGRANAELVRARYRQEHYGQQLAALYHTLLN